MMGVDDVAAVREIHQQRTACVLCQQRIVLIRQAAPQTPHGDPFAPFQLPQKRNTVEDLAVHIPVQVQTGKTVHGKLHVVDGLEGIVLQEIGEIGLWHDEQGEWYLIPLDAALGMDIELTPRIEPEPLIDREFRVVIGIVGT